MVDGDYGGRGKEGREQVGVYGGMRQQDGVIGW